MESDTLCRVASSEFFRIFFANIICGIIAKTGVIYGNVAKCRLVGRLLIQSQHGKPGRRLRTKLGASHNRRAGAASKAKILAASLQEQQQGGRRRVDVCIGRDNGTGVTDEGTRVNS